LDIRCVNRLVRRLKIAPLLRRRLRRLSRIRLRRLTRLRPLSLLLHQHTGARNVSLAIDGKTFCTSYPTYGTEVGVPGNEKNHLVKMSTCYRYNASGTEPPLTIKKGSTISVNAWYYVGGDDPELGVDLGGTHMGVMSYMYLGYAVAHDAQKEDLKLLPEQGWSIVDA
jgi:hypothetical protein